MKKVAEYIAKWKTMGYSDDIPDEVPDILMQLGLAPSYKQIAICILKNDLQFTGLGFTPKCSEWYGVLKRIEISKRESADNKYNLFEYIETLEEKVDALSKV